MYFANHSFGISFSIDPVFWYVSYLVFLSMHSVQSLVLLLCDLKPINQQTGVCSRICSLNLYFRCVEDSVNDSKNRAAQHENSSVQQVRSLQSWGKYKTIQFWVNPSETTDPFIWFKQLEWCIKSERLLQGRGKCTQKLLHWELNLGTWYGSVS